MPPKNIPTSPASPADMLKLQNVPLVEWLVMHMSIVNEHKKRMVRGMTAPLNSDQGVLRAMAYESCLEEIKRAKRLRAFGSPEASPPA